MKSIVNTALFKLVFPVCFALSIQVAKGQRLMEQTVTTYTGSAVKLAEFGGKRLLVMILPVSSTDSIYQQVKTFCTKHKDSVQVLGVLSEEDGASAVTVQAISKMYQGIPSLLVLQKGFTRKSASQQTTLMHWLTHKEANYRYDTDVAGVGQKFFIDRVARLVAVLPAHVSLQSPIVDRILQAGPPAFHAYSSTPHQP